MRSSAAVQRRPCLQVMPVRTITHPGELLSSFAFYQWVVELGDLDCASDAEEPQDFDLNPRRIKLVPRQSMPRGSRMGVVVVMPSLSERNQRDQPVIARIIACGES